jgi:4-amino-4-deoxy-L-arabinose transferase-like glycosyltransferase
MGAAAVGEGHIHRATLRADYARALALLAMVGLVYVGLVVGLAPAQLVGDESAYLSFATNLTHGYYSPPGEIHLWWGPGYPLLLAPLMALHAPVLIARLLNVILLLGALALIYATASHYVTRRAAVLLTAFAALYIPTLQAVGLLLSEPLAVFLASLAMYQFTWQQGRLGTLGAAVALAWLALTKVLFGWVLLAALLVALVVLLRTRRAEYRRWLACCGVALLLCSPYLVYTAGVTGRAFYWGTSGGLSLYWMSTPYAGELGDWFPLSAMRDDPRLAPEHRQLFARIDGLDEVRQDDALKSQAIENIQHHPAKFALNWLANLGRLFINYPYSFTPMRLGSLVVGLLNVPIVIMTALMLVRRRQIPPALAAVGLVALIALGASTLLSAYPRQLVPLAPWLLVIGATTLWRPRGV